MTDRISYRYENGFFTPEQTAELFDNAMNSMTKIHEDRGVYRHISSYLENELGMRDALCVQTFFIGMGYDISWPHIDIATAIFPSITNMWVCEDDCPGEPFGFLERQGREELYKDWFSAIERGEIADFESLCTEELVKDYWRVTDYKKGDALFFDSRQVHKKLSATPRRTLVFKYINSEDLENVAPINYSRIPKGREWVRILIFDHLRHIKGHEERKRYLRDTEALLGSLTSERPAETESSKSLLKRFLGR